MDNADLRGKVAELEEELRISEERHNTLVQINSQMSQELTRWRERLDEGDVVE